MYHIHEHCQSSPSLMSILMYFHLAFLIKYFIKKKNKKTPLFGCVIAFAQAFSSCGKQGLLFIVVLAFPLQWILWFQSTGCRFEAFISRGT